MRIRGFLTAALLCLSLVSFLSVHFSNDSLPTDLYEEKLVAETSSDGEEVQPTVPVGAKGLFSGSKSCMKLAQETSEPYTPEYHRIDYQVDTDGPQWAFYQHEGKITWDDMEDAGQKLSHYKAKIKFVAGKIYYREEDLARMGAVLQHRTMMFLSSILMAAAWFEVPDVEFYFCPDDFAAPPGGPILQFAGNNFTGAMYDGFTVPFAKAVDYCLGPTQMSILRACITERYHTEEKVPKAIWRGTSRPTNGRISSEKRIGPREKAIMLGSRIKEYADFQSTKFFGTDETRCLSFQNFTKNGDCPSAANWMPVEDSSKYAFVMDMDGRGYSGRITELLLLNTIILKQISRYPDYLSPFLLKEKPVELIKSDMSDMEEKVKQVVTHFRKDSIGYQEEMMKKMKDFSRMHGSHFGVARAVAYTLTVFAGKAVWIPQWEEGFHEMDFKRLVFPNLPQEFMDRIQSKYEVKEHH